MTAPSQDARDPRKVRMGLAIISAVVAVAIVMFLVVDAPAGKAVMFAIAATAFVRAYGLARWLRRTQAGGGS